MYNPIDLNRIDRQIEDLQRLKASYQNFGQPPINNIITTPQPQSQVQSRPIQENRPIFEARFTTENPADTFIQNKTAFINLKDNILTIKEVDGNIKEYEIIPPKDEKDIRIQQLENEINILKENYISLQANAINNFQHNSNQSESTPQSTNNQSNTSLEPIVFEPSKNNYTVTEQTSFSDKIKSKFKK